MLGIEVITWQTIFLQSVLYSGKITRERNSIPSQWIFING